MCGFGVVVYKQDQHLNRQILNRFIAGQLHRGPDGSSIYLDEQIGMAHCRLAVFDTSNKGIQPMEGWGSWIVFNGAIYNYVEIRKTLITFGYAFNTNSDTEVILAAYDHYGNKCFELFNGQWALVIFDKKNQKLVISRDRFGIKPLYYYDDAEKWIYSSEIKGIKEFPGVKVSINSNRIFEFLLYKMHDHTEESMFAEIKKVKPGCYLILDLKSTEIIETPYYSIDAIETIPIGEQEAIKKFRDLFHQSINFRLRSDVPIGGSLSGGLDSSSICLSVSKIRQDQFKFPVFSAVYDDKEISEDQYVDAVVKRGNFQSFQFTPSFDNFRKIVDKILYHQDELFNGMGVYAQYCVYQKASDEGIKVMLGGQGADEILAGYEKFYYPVLKKLIKENPIKGIILARRIFQSHNFSFLDSIIQLKKYMTSGRGGIPDWITLDVDSTNFFRRPKEDTILDMSKNLIAGLGLSALLRYEDRNSMAHGIESRLPFLDHHLVEFCLALPDELKIKNGARKWILRESNHDILPDKIYSRTNKLGFATPEQKWLVEHQPYFLDEIENSKPFLKGIINFQKLPRLKRDLLWRVFILGKWLKLNEETL